jgi:hypothetical protein
LTGWAKAITPLLIGLSNPFNVVQLNSDMENVSTIIALTVVQAQNQKNLGSMEKVNGEFSLDCTGHKNNFIGRD